MDMFHTAQGSHGCVRRRAWRKVEHDGDRRLDRWSWKLRAVGPSNGLQSIGIVPDVEIGLMTAGELLFDRGRSDVTTRFDGVAGRRRE